ncbi:MAG: MFS family permease [Pirellulaceae bacterium]|jgi:MFS family permease
MDEQPLNTTDADELLTSASPSNSKLPPLSRDVAFYSITVTQFLGAFNDNVFKQILLLMFVAVPIGITATSTDTGSAIQIETPVKTIEAEIASGTLENPSVEKLNGTLNSATTMDLQPLATFVFALPFVLFSGYAGYLSDRFSKRRVIVLSKVTELVIMAIGLALFASYSATGLTMSLVIFLSATLFLMGTQSTFFGPGKYGILPELFDNKDLPSANGLILMTTFLAIILGSALAGQLLDAFPGQLWVSGLFCVVIAAIGIGTCLGIRKVAPSSAGIRFEWGNLAIPQEIRALLRKDKAIMFAVSASSVFWLAASMVLMAVNSLGELQLHTSKLETGLLISSVSVGIAFGSIIAGAISKNYFRGDLIQIGAWGAALTLSALAIPPITGSPHILGYYGCMAALILLGGFTGVFAVPLQVFLQSRPPDALKGRMIATQNLLNWIGILLSAGIYALATAAFALLDAPVNAMFGVTAVIMAGIGLFYRPKTISL